MSISSLIGLPVSQLDTPSLVLDEAVFEENVATITGLLATHGVGWRPHAKAHKTPAIAHRLIAAGAHGITCAKLSEAEVYAASGITDILIASQLAGPIKARRFAELARHCDVISAVDSIEGASALDAAAGAARTRPRVVLELDCGMKRGGVQPVEPALRLAEQVEALANLRLVGVMAWEGHVLGIADANERNAAIREAVSQVIATAEAMRQAGHTVEIVSCGGTGTLSATPGIEGVTEVQAGGGIYGDLFYRRLGIPVKPALSIRVTVTSRPTPTRILVDAGRKTVDPSNVPPVVDGIDGVEAVVLSAEHGNIHLAARSDVPQVGDTISLLIGYSDQAVHLHEQVYVVRDGLVTAIWPTLARGKLS